MYLFCSEGLDAIALKKLVNFVNCLMEQYFSFVERRVLLEVGFTGKNHGNTDTLISHTCIPIVDTCAGFLDFQAKELVVISNRENVM